MTDGVLFMIDRLIAGSFNTTQDNLIFDQSTYCVMYYKLGLRDALGLNVAIKWRNGILHKMNANAMKTRLDQTRTRQPDTGVALRSRALVWQPSSQIKSSEWTDNCPTRVSPSPASAAHCGSYEKEARPGPDRQTGGRGWHCGHALGSNSPPLLHHITLYQYLAWRVYSLWSVHNHLTGYWFTLTKRSPSQR